MGEANKQLILVGWGGGGSPVLRYASKRPERVAAVGLLDVYVGNIIILFGRRL